MDDLGSGRGSQARHRGGGGGDRQTDKEKGRGGMGGAAVSNAGVGVNYRGPERQECGVTFRSWSHLAVQASHPISKHRQWMGNTNTGGGSLKESCPLYEAHFQP